MSVIVTAVTDTWETPDTGFGRRRPYDNSLDLAIQQIDTILAALPIPSWFPLGNLPRLGLPSAPSLPRLPGMQELMDSFRAGFEGGNRIRAVYDDVRREAEHEGMVPIISEPDRAWSSRPAGGWVTPDKSGPYGLAV